MAGAGAGADHGPPTAEEAGTLVPGDPDWRDWAGGVPEELLVKVAGKVISQNEAGWAAHLKEVLGWNEKSIQETMAERKRDGNCLFKLALVCREWRKAQLKVGGPLRSRVASDVILPGSVALAKWALAEGCPRDDGYGYTMACEAARHGHLELVKGLYGEQGFEMHVLMMEGAAQGGNVELVRWLRGKGCDWSAGTCMFAAAAGQTGVLQWLRAHGCPWNADTCRLAALGGHLATLRWARENGCPWVAGTRDRAAAELGYTDDFGNLVDWDGNPVQ